MVWTALARYNLFFIFLIDILYNIWYDMVKTAKMIKSANKNGIILSILEIRLLVNQWRNMKIGKNERKFHQILTKIW